MSEFPSKSGDPAIDHPAIGLELRLAWTPCTDPALGSRQMGPHALQSRPHILELCELDLESCLCSSRPQSEDVQNELGPVHDTNTDSLLQCRTLGRRQIFIEHDESRGLFFSKEFELVRLTASDVRSGVWRRESLNQRPGDLGSRRIDEACEFLQMLIDQALRFVDSRRADQDGTFDGRTEFDRRARRSVSCFAVFRATRLGTGLDLPRLFSGLADFPHADDDPRLDALISGLVERRSGQGIRQICLGSHCRVPVMIVAISSPVAEVLHQTGRGIPNMQRHRLGWRVSCGPGRGTECPVHAIGLRRDGQVQAGLGERQLALG